MRYLCRVREREEILEQRKPGSGLCRLEGKRWCDSPCMGPVVFRETEEKGSV